ncbi:hypothetical protein V3C99_000841 [Haemonchus contortus]
MYRLSLATCILLGLQSLSCRAQFPSSTSATTTTTEARMPYSTTTRMSYSTTTTAPASQPPSTTTSTPPWNPTTAAPSSNIDQCKCTDKNIWLDIYFLMDASYAMTSPGFDGATAFVQSVLSKMTLGQDYAQQTRAGFILYAANATVQYNLTWWTSTYDMLFNMNLTYSGSLGTNIEAGIQLATDRFNSAEHRANAQKVIVIVASAYETGKESDPTKAANTFKESGGIIITVEYVQEHGAAVPLLGSLASPGPYQFTNRYGNLTNEEVRQAFCKANCFCPTNYDPYTIGDTVPHGGCYRTVPLTAIQMLAANNCRKQHSGTLANVQSRDKSLFLGALFPSKTKFWIGLQRDNGGRWYWPDGTYLQSNDYQMWAPGYPSAAAGDCVYMYQYSGFSFGWFNDDCYDDYEYVCQTVPCCADNYCSTLA